MTGGWRGCGPPGKLTQRGIQQCRGQSSPSMGSLATKEELRFGDTKPGCSAGLAVQKSGRWKKHGEKTISRTWSAISTFRGSAKKIHEKNSGHQILRFWQLVQTHEFHVQYTVWYIQAFYDMVVCGFTNIAQEKCRDFYIVQVKKPFCPFWGLKKIF